ncbi:MAG: hypothetical protein P4L10_03680 [Acidobacteriaceae bacterium]|jgi:hypothetical protein|nr:hypothetical protein [Acidobacteriaceae bacterium]
MAKPLSSRSVGVSDIRLVIDGVTVPNIPSGKAGETLARKEVKAAIANGAKYAEIFVLRRVFGHDTCWIRIAQYHQKEPRQYFRDAAQNTENTGIAMALRLPSREHAACLMDAALKSPRGRDEISLLSANIKPDEERSEPIRNLFVIRITVDHDGMLIYRVEPLPGRTHELSQLYRVAGSGKPEKISKTPHHVYHDRGRQRGLSLKR